MECIECFDLCPTPFSSSLNVLYSIVTKCICTRTCNVRYHQVGLSVSGGGAGIDVMGVARQPSSSTSSEQSLASRYGIR